MKSFVLLLLFTFVYASSYPSFTQCELENIEKQSGVIAKNRILDYDEAVSSYKPYPKPEQLIKVNFYLNQLLPQVDILNQETADYWSTPKEFLTIGYGDCEDYAIIKYFTLLKLGFEKEKLFITAVYEKYKGGYHMVLSYFEEFNKPPLILDNLSFRILDLNTREDLQADLFINQDGIYKIDENNTLFKISATSKKFKELLKRVRKGS
ncbi:transglutaminase-like cysteine peptidase [bacterium]|nr:transglutaminase-like cysteine peptidase [bacterium]MBU1995173.1 transglutaminase-like cysteine peptidase [bacterium]